MANPYQHHQKLPETGEGEEYVLVSDAERLYDLEVDESIVAWRMEAFEALGFEPLHAGALATRRDVDREEVARMIQAGATPTQVLAILL